MSTYSWRNALPATEASDRMDLLAFDVTDDSQADAARNKEHRKRQAFEDSKRSYRNERVVLQPGVPVSSSTYSIFYSY